MRQSEAALALIRIELQRIGLGDLIEHIEARRHNRIGRLHRIAALVDKRGFLGLRRIADPHLRQRGHRIELPLRGGDLFVQSGKLPMLVVRGDHAAGALDPMCGRPGLASVVAGHSAPCLTVRGYLNLILTRRGAADFPFLDAAIATGIEKGDTVDFLWLRKRKG